ncbi:MAG TPA: aminotransferase class V-fold PLP-dependent enzyme, partial [Candidatus Paceibacterota bacterium]|nr:aminotransferase class V-fold PLP-dependent enzyme [Candidatus Paceibacterota bacterium]
MPIFKHFSGKTRIYLDYASSTPRDMGMARRVPKIPIRIHAANPSALHSEGVALRRVLNDARERVARVLEVHRDEIIFTSGATESDNLAIVGAIYGLLKKGIAHNDIVVISSDLEHAAVTETIKHVVTSGVRHVSLSTTDGVVDPKDIVVPNGAKAVVVSVMYVNNEIGTVQPISDIAKRMRKLRADHPNVQFIFHTDATQAPLHFSLRVPALGVDLMTLGATKLYCTKGVGALYKKRAVELMPVLHGGGQEFGMRPGTESVELMHEFSHALLYAQERR